MSDTVPQLLTLLAVAKALCVSPYTVRAWVRKGKLHPVRICRRLLFDPAEVARFLSDAREVKASTAGGVTIEALQAINAGMPPPSSSRRIPQSASDAVMLCNGKGEVSTKTPWLRC